MTPSTSERALRIVAALVPFAPLFTLPAAFAQALLDLYRDEALWNRLSANGLLNVTRHFSLQAAEATVRKVFLDR